MAKARHHPGLKLVAREVSSSARSQGVSLYKLRRVAVSDEMQKQHIFLYKAHACCLSKDSITRPGNLSCRPKTRTVHIAATIVKKTKACTPDYFLMVIKRDKKKTRKKNHRPKLPKTQKKKRSILLTIQSKQECLTKTPTPTTSRSRPQKRRDPRRLKPPVGQRCSEHTLRHIFAASLDLILELMARARIPRTPNAR